MALISVGREESRKIRNQKSEIRSGGFTFKFKCKFK